MGDTNGNSNVGGITGYWFLGENCYNAGVVTGTSKVGQFVGYSDHNENLSYAPNCYTKLDEGETIRGEDASFVDPNITAMSLDEMKNENFKNTLNTNRASHDDWCEWLWDANENEGLPYLNLSQDE